ncbi:MAG TPA: hypothetical protein VIJ76_04595, partial [Galbitalea sp.]
WDVAPTEFPGRPADTVLMELASAVFEAELAPASRRPGMLKLEVTAPLDLVIRRRDDGTEIVRMPAELDTPDILLETAQRDLDTMTVDEFLAEWRMPEV